VPIVSRRTILRILAAAFAYAGAGSRAARGEVTAAPSNFKAIYSDSRLRERFYLFLRNVFHLYPEERFHQLILDATRTESSDRRSTRRFRRACRASSHDSRS